MAGSKIACERRRLKRAKRRAKAAGIPFVAPAPAKSAQVPRLPAAVDVASPAFLQTPAWRKLRYKALRLYGARCQCCGASPKTGAVINVDHIKPRKTYPHLALTLDNLQILCADCNAGKGNADDTDWRGVGEERYSIDANLDVAALVQLCERGRVN